MPGDLHRVLAAAALVVLFPAHAPAETLEDRFGDGSSSSCTSNATQIEQKILDRESDTYDYPSPAAASGVLAAVDALLDGDAALANAEAASSGYEVEEFFDADRQRPFLFLQPVGGSNPGHGYFVFDPAGRRGLVIQAPHVGFDTRTVDFAIEAFAVTRAFALLIPGSDRYANHDCNGCNSPCSLLPGRDNSDVTRTEDPLFHLVHQRLLDRFTGECRRPLVVQFHGFGTSTASKAGCGYDFILSDGDGARTVDPVFLTHLGQKLEQHTLDGSGDPADAYTWNVASGVGGDCSQLLATLNRQGASTRAAGAMFAHVEMHRDVRAWPDASDAAEIAAALAESRLAALTVTATRGAGEEVILSWPEGTGEETLYRATSATAFCGTSSSFPAASGTFTDDPGPGLFFYRVE